MIVAMNLSIKPPGRKAIPRVFEHGLRSKVVLKIAQQCLELELGRKSYSLYKQLLRFTTDP